jgi:hypothetical protein
LRLILKAYSLLIGVLSMDTADRKPQSPPPEEYGLEVLCASWNPVVAAVAEPVRVCRELLTELSASDGDAFLRQFYRCQKS